MNGSFKIETIFDEVNKKCTVTTTWSNLNLTSLSNAKKVFHPVPGKSSSWLLETTVQLLDIPSLDEICNKKVNISFTHLSGNTEIGSGTLSLMGNSTDDAYKTEKFNFMNNSGKLCQIEDNYKCNYSYNRYEYYRYDSYTNRQSLAVLIREGFIKIVCSITFTNYAVNQSNLNPSDENIGTKQFWKKMYTSKVLTDVKFALGNVVLEGHRAVLSNRSDVFARMFQQDMVEKNRNNAIPIMDCDSAAFDVFLKYLYVNEIEDSTSKDWEIVLPLLQVAHKYNVNCLVEICGDLLIESFSIGNVLKILQVADLHQVKKLKDSAKTFVKRNFNTIGASAEWSTMINSHPSIVTDFFVFMTSIQK